MNFLLPVLAILFFSLNLSATSVDYSESQGELTSSENETGVEVVPNDQTTLLIDPENRDDYDGGMSWNQKSALCKASCQFHTDSFEYTRCWSDCMGIGPGS